MAIFMNNPFIHNCVQWALAYEETMIRLELRERREVLRKYIQTLKREAAENLEFLQLADRHFIAMKLADASFHLLRGSADDLRKLDDVIKHLKEARKVYRKKKDKSRSNECTTLISRLAESYHGIREERDMLRRKTGELNERTATLRDRIKENCGKRGEAWANRLEQRKAEHYKES